jgi:predicted metal-dependent hydrolase
MFDQVFNIKTEPKTDNLQVGSRSVPLLFVHHPRARRYLLRLRRDGIARVTIPRRGTVSAAREFASRNINWLETQLQRLAVQPKTPVPWNLGTKILFRGELVCIEITENGVICFGDQQVKIFDPLADLRPIIQKHLHNLATKELPLRVMELATLHDINISRVTVRNQKSRWGSCSRKGTISLNWRLIQAPTLVSDYIILHELAHRRHMNHSNKYWQELARLCPNYLEAERWLKGHRELLR